MDHNTSYELNPIIRKIESGGYRVLHLLPYLPDLNPTERFWALLKGKVKRHRLMNEENLSQSLADACNNVRLSDLHKFCRHSKRQIII